jgi:hypothetical protein
LKRNLAENLVLMEMLKFRYNAGKGSNLYFFRDHTGNEVDLVLDTPQGIRGIEVKTAQTVTGAFFRPLEFLGRISSELSSAHLVYGGEQRRVQRGVEIIPWCEMGSLRPIVV